MRNIHLVISGHEASAAAELLESSLKEGDEGLEISRASPSVLPDVPGKAVDPLAFAGVILAFPAAALAVADLVQRIRKRLKAKKLIETAEHVRQAKGVMVLVVAADGTLKSLSEMTADDLLDIAQAPDGGRETAGRS